MGRQMLTCRETGRLGVQDQDQLGQDQLGQDQDQLL